MGTKEARRVLEQYKSLLKNVGPKDGPMRDAPQSYEILPHLAGMLSKMEEFLSEAEDPLRDSYDDPRESWDKFNRWLGFIQGCFWSQGMFTLEQMRNHNRSQPERSF